MPKVSGHYQGVWKSVTAIYHSYIATTNFKINNLTSQNYFFGEKL